MTIGGALHDTAHLSGGAIPSGTITFRLFGPGDSACAGHPAFTSTVAVAGNNDYASESFVPTAAGVYRWVVSYSGDARNNPAGPTACGDSAEIAFVRELGITPLVIPVFSTTASQPAQLGTPLYDIAHLSGSLDPGGTITFSLFGPDEPSCLGPPVFTTTAAVTGNGDYRSGAFVAGLPGTYHWVVTYSGDANDTGAGPTACGDSAETASLARAPVLTPSPALTPGANPDPGPNFAAPRPAKPHHKAKHQKAKPPHPHKGQPPPPVTG